MPDRRASRLPWPVLLVLRRWRARWRLQAALLLVSTVAAAALGALVPVVQATEPAAVRTAIAGLPPARTAVDVQVVQPGDEPETLRRDLGRGLAAQLRTRSLPPSSVAALAQPLRTDAVPGGALVYAAAVDSPGEVGQLVSGAWPAEGSRGAAVPQAAARALGLAVGDRVPLTGDSGPAPVLRITGIYRPRTDAAFWQLDPLLTKGEDPAFVDPATAFGEPGQAFGPLLTPRGAFDGGELPLLVVDLRFQPDLRGVAPDGLRATAGRIEAAGSAITASVGAASLGVGTTSEAPRSLRDVAAALDAVRALVAVSGTLLAALTVAVLLIAARLIAVARAGEQRVLTERGAASRHVVGLAVAEAGATGLLIAVLAPWPAVGLYALLVAVPGAVAAGVPGTVGPSAALWTVTAGFGLVLAVVLAVAALRPPVRDRSGRAARISGAARSGVDLAVLVVAVVLLQRLLADPGPPSGAVLLAPVLLLLAAALVGLRLVALVGQALEPVAARTRSVVGALAAVELGRRSQRSAAAVLVVALGLGCGAFGLAQLATWQRSQRDQAVFAVGVPARAAATGRTAASTRAVRALDARAAVVLRGDGLLTAGAGSGGSTASVAVLAPPDAQRRLLARMPAARGLGVLEPAPVGTEQRLPAGTEALRLSLPAASVSLPRPEGATVAALLRTADGLVVSPATTLPRTRADVVVDLDGVDATALVGLRVTLPPGGTGPESGRGSRFLIGRVAATGSGGTDLLPRTQSWQVVEAGAAAGQVSSGRDVFADFTAAAQPGEDAVVQVLSWSPTAVPVVLDRAAAAASMLGPGAGGRVIVVGTPVAVDVEGVVRHVPGSARVAEVASGAGATTSSVLIAGREQLQRALIEQGASEQLEREWWLSTGDTSSAALARLGRGTTAIGAEQVTGAFQDGPLRIAVRPALLLLTGTAALLLLVAFLVQTASARHDRRFDLAQLRAAGATRGELARLDALVAAVLIGLGALVGLHTAVAIASWAGPRLITGPTGGAPVPGVVFDPAVGAVAAVAGGVALVLLAVTAGTALAADRGTAARLIRLGGEP